MNANGNIYHSDPTIVDTDGDTLDDCIEVYLHGTDPSKKDTDGDGVDDNIELEIGSDPLVAELSFTRTVSKQSTAKKVTASATLSNASGKAVNTLAVEEVEDDPFLNSNIQGYIDSAFEFNSDGNIGTAKISFTMDNMPSSARIYYVNDKEHKLEALDCDRNGNTISASVKHFSKYILIDADKFDKAFTELPLYNEYREKPVDVVIAVDRALFDPNKLRQEICADIMQTLDSGESDRVTLIFGNGFYGGWQSGGEYDSTICYDFSTSLSEAKESFNKLDLEFFEANLQDRIDDSAYTLSLLKESLDLFPAKGESGYRENSEKILVIINSGVDIRFEGGIDGKDIIDGMDDEGKKVDKIISIGLKNLAGEIDEDGMKTFAGTNNCYMAANYNGLSVPTVQDPIDYEDMISSGGTGVYNDHIAEMLRDGTIRDIYGRKVFGDNPDINKCKATADFDGDQLENYKEIEIAQNGSILTAWYNSDPIKKDTDGDGIPDNEDDKPLIPLTIQNLFPLDVKYSKKNPVNIEVYKNTINVTAYVMFDGDVGEIYPDTNMTYESIIEKSIEQYWTKEFSGSKYDFAPSIKGKIIANIIVGDKPVGSDGQHYFKITIDAHDITDKERALYATNEFIKSPMTMWSGQWSWETQREIYMPRCDIRNNTSKSAEQYGNSVSHEFGHVLGLADAYPDANRGKKFKNTFEISRGDDEQHTTSNIMNSNNGNRIVYANDIEMVLESYCTNNYQYYYNLPYISDTEPQTIRSRVIRLSQDEVW